MNKIFIVISVNITDGSDYRPTVHAVVTNVNVAINAAEHVIASFVEKNKDHFTFITSGDDFHKRVVDQNGECGIIVDIAVVQHDQMYFPMP